MKNNMFIFLLLTIVCITMLVSSCTAPEEDVAIIIPVTAPEEDFVIIIPDTNLAAAVREVINKPTGDIMKSDVSKITSFKSSFNSIVKLDGLEHFDSLKYLTLNDNRIVSIAPLSELANLEELFLSGNQFIDDLEPLKNLHSLTQLTLSSNSITDISPITGLTNLKNLDLAYNKIKNVKPLEGLTGLNNLNIGNNDINDLSPLEALVNTTIDPTVVTEFREGLISTINHTEATVSFTIDRDALPPKIRNFTNVSVSTKKITEPNYNDAYNVRKQGLQLTAMETREKYDDEQGFSLSYLEHGSYNVLIVIFDQNNKPVGYFEKMLEIPDHDIVLQIGNKTDKDILQTFFSYELEDNRLMNQANSFWLYFNEGFSDPIAIWHGFKEIILSMEHGDWDMVQWDKPELSIRSDHDQEISHIVDSGVDIIYTLCFWDKAYVNEGNELSIPRFTTQEEIDRYLEFVEFSVRHFKGRVKYYELWNEPNIGDSIQYIRPEDYVNVAMQAIPIIRKEDPMAKIIFGGVAGIGQGRTGESESETYLFELLKPEILPNVDVISWHPWTSGTSDMPGIDEHMEEYLNYINSIKTTAEANGFTGEYLADELNWQGKVQPHDPVRIHYDDDIAAKFHIRGSIMHLGLDIAVGYIYIEGRNPIIQNTVRNINTLMAGAKACEIPLTIDTEAENIMHYGFVKSNGDYLVAIWSDVPPVSKCNGSKSTIFIPDISSSEVSAIDLLYGFEQKLNFRAANGGIYIDDLIIGDYPLVLRLSDNE